MELQSFPATLGRHTECTLQLNVDRVSRLHARFTEDGEALSIEDLGSTNGTFVNHMRIDSPTRVKVGDVIHLADHEFRLMRDRAFGGGKGPVSSEDTVIGMDALPQEFPLQMAALFDLLENGRVESFAQRIFRADGRLYGFELLGRSGHDELQEGPDQLFSLAAALNCEVQLSRLFRRKSFEAAAALGLKQPLFFNNHPAECDDFNKLLAELSTLRDRFPQLNLVFEMHESAVTDRDTMASLRQELNRMGIRLAYDDFGAGQARLLELVEVPPDILKFDISLIRDLEDRDSPKYQLLTTLNDLISTMGIKTLAEGVESPLSAQLCRDIGIDFFQGFHFDLPKPLDRLDGPPR
jgi:EAL domain-containing protein (putative c-di-GMP-specific phosphodiesterase class I)